MVTKILVSIASALVVLIILLGLFIIFKSVEENKMILLDINQNCWATE